MKINASSWICYSRRKLGLTCQTLLVVLSIPLAVRAQQDTIPQRGFHPAGSYALTDLETINTANGNLMFRIPLVSLPPGRGGTPGSTVNLYYNSKLWDTFVWVQGGCQPINPMDRNDLVQSPDGGWRYAFMYELRLDNRLDHFSNPSINCNDPGSDNIYKLEMSFPDGSVREFRPQGFSDFFGDGYFYIRPDGHPVPCPGRVPVTSAMTYYSTDASYLKLVINHDTDDIWSNNPWTFVFARWQPGYEWKPTPVH